MATKRTRGRESGDVINKVKKEIKMEVYCEGADRGWMWWRVTRERREKII